MTTRYTRKDSATARPSAEHAPTPNLPLRSDEIAFDRWAEGCRYGGGSIPLGELGGRQRIGVNLSELPAGKQNCPLHWHMKEEEHFFILEGRCILRTSDRRHEMRAGDYVCFPAGTRVAHAFENPFDAPCRMLEIGNKDDDEIAVYPQSNKAKLRALGIIVPLPDGAGLDYWDGERADEPLG